MTPRRIKTTTFEFWIPVPPKYHLSEQVVPIVKLFGLAAAISSVVVSQWCHQIRVGCQFRRWQCMEIVSFLFRFELISRGNLDLIWIQTEQKNKCLSWKRKRQKKEIFSSTHLTLSITGPWLVALFKRDNHVCDGTLVSSHWVLTTTSCFQGQSKEKWVAVFGNIRISAGISSPWTQKRRIVSSKNVDLHSLQLFNLFQNRLEW